MLDLAFRFLRDEVNAYLTTRMGQGAFQVSFCRVVDEAGKYLVPAESLGLSLLNVEEERMGKSPGLEYTMTDGRQVALQPTVRLNLSVLFSANFTDYQTGLTYLSKVMTFFQANSNFLAAECPDMDPLLVRLVVELQSLSFDQLNQLWTFVGGKQLPSVVYKIRLIALQDGVQDGIQPPITRTQVEAHRA